MSHTPGPWRVHSVYKDVIVSDTPDQRYSKVLAECPGYKEERVKNAKLIASAPELLEALETLMKAYVSIASDQDCSDQYWQEQNDENYLIAKAAITKARG